MKIPTVRGLGKFNPGLGVFNPGLGTLKLIEEVSHAPNFDLRPKSP